MHKIHTSTYRDIHFESVTLLSHYVDQLTLLIAKRYYNSNAKTNYYDVLKITPKATQNQVSNFKVEFLAQVEEVS